MHIYMHVYTRSVCVCVFRCIYFASIMYSDSKMTESTVCAVVSIEPNYNTLH